MRFSSGLLRAALSSSAALPNSSELQMAGPPIAPAWLEHRIWPRAPCARWCWSPPMVVPRGARCAGTARSCRAGKSGVSPLGRLRLSTVSVTPTWWTLRPTRPRQHSALCGSVSVNPGSDSGMMETLRNWYQCAQRLHCFILFRGQQLRKPNLVSLCACRFQFVLRTQRAHSSRPR